MATEGDNVERGRWCLFFLLGTGGGSRTCNDRGDQKRKEKKDSSGMSSDERTSMLTKKNKNGVVENRKLVEGPESPTLNDVFLWGKFGGDETATTKV